MIPLPPPPEIDNGERLFRLKQMKKRYVRLPVVKMENYKKIKRLEDHLNVLIKKEKEKK